MDSTAFMAAAIESSMARQQATAGWQDPAQASAGAPAGDAA